MTVTDICNLALSYLNKGRIISFDEDTEEAIQCKMHYDHCRKRLLRAYSWGFAKSQVKLAQKPQTALGWDYTYAYPADCLAVRFVFDEQTAKLRETERENFELVNFNGMPSLACDIPQAYAEYTRDEKNAEKFSEEFIEALARLLAADMAMVLTGSGNMQQMNYQLMQAAVLEAKTQNATEQEKKTEWPKDYAAARFRE